jgi:MarR family transcriptional regulator, organic hydroperoxide resistance regulator
MMTISKDYRLGNSEVSELLKLDNQLCFRLYMASRNMTRLYTPILERFHLTYPQYIIILVLLEHSEIDFKELSNRVDLRTGTMTPIVQRLEEIGYIERKKNPLDARKITISLTEKGSELRNRLATVPIEVSRSIELNETDYIKLVESLDLLTSKLTKAP